MTIAAVSERASELEKLCVRYHVERLDLFGSAASGGHREGASDLDFLVEKIARYVAKELGAQRSLRSMLTARSEESA